MQSAETAPCGVVLCDSNALNPRSGVNIKPFAESLEVEALRASVTRPRLRRVRRPAGCPARVDAEPQVTPLDECPAQVGGGLLGELGPLPVVDVGEGAEPPEHPPVPVPRRLGPDQ